MSLYLPMENRPSGRPLTSIAHIERPAAKSLQHNAFSIQSAGNGGVDGSLSALSYAVTSPRTQLVVAEGFRTECRWVFNAHSDSQITNFNILVGWEIGIAHLRQSNVGGRHG